MKNSSSSAKSYGHQSVIDGETTYLWYSKIDIKVIGPFVYKCPWEFLCQSGIVVKKLEEHFHRYIALLIVFL